LILGTAEGHHTMSLMFEDVLSFPEEARACLSSQPELCQEFLDVIGKYAAEE